MTTDGFLYRIGETKVGEWIGNQLDTGPPLIPFLFMFCVGLIIASTVAFWVGTTSETLASPETIPLISPISFLIYTIILAEIIFFFVDKAKPDKGTTIIKFTIVRKFIAIALASISIMVVGGMCRILIKYWAKILNVVVIGAIIIIALIIYISINSIKFRRKQNGK